jgi:hypothetical protein
MRIAGHIDQQIAEHAIDRASGAFPPFPGAGKSGERAISSSYTLVVTRLVGRGAWLVGPMNSPENKYDSDG